MKRKTINAVLAKTLDKFAASITDERVRKLVEKNSIITGGCIASMLLKEKVNDYDIYFANMETAMAVAKYYAKGIKDVSVIEGNGRVTIKVVSAGIAGKDGVDSAYRYFEQDQDPRTTDAMEYVEEAMEAVGAEESEPYGLKFLTSNAITLNGNIQLIIRFVGDPAEIHKNYDFVHCTNYWTPKEKLVLHPAAIEALLARELRYVGSLYPICSMIRTRKFIMRGYTINAGQYLKMAMQISELDLSDIRVLEDQLTGVDVHYFLEVIDLLKKKTEAGKPIDSAYLVEVIDRMF